MQSSSYHVKLKYQTYRQPIVYPLINSVISNIIVEN